MNAERGLPKVVMTYKLRDEADVIADNVRYHVGQGIDTFLAADNGSTDGTREILAGFEDRGLMRVFDEPAEDFRQESRHWLTKMARFAAEELGADWVIHNDADEFWWPVQGTIPEALAGIPPEFGAVISPRSEFVTRPEDDRHFAERMDVRETRARLRPKVAHRAEPNVVVLHRGAHDVALAAPDGDGLAIRSPGRPVLRGARDEIDEGDDEKLVWAPNHPLRTFHFPLRTYEQFERKARTTVLHGAFADRGNRKVVREHIENGTLREFYESQIESQEEVERRIAAGELVVDRRFAAFLALCLDPMAADGPTPLPPRPQPSPEELRAEAEELELETMRVMSRTQRLLIGRLANARESLREAEAEAEKAQRAKKRARRKLKRVRGRLAKIEARPLNRVRRSMARLVHRKGS